METTYFGVRGAAATLRERLLAAGIVTTAASALLYLWRFNPATAGNSYYPSCPFHTLTGLNCPGCGTLRGLHQLLHGHLLTALNHNVLMVLMLPYFGYALFSYASVALRGRGLRQPFIKPVYLKAFVWVMMGFWILRNIPAFPFTLLSP